MEDDDQDPLIAALPYGRAYSPRTALRIQQAKLDLASMKKEISDNLHKATGVLEAASSQLIKYFATIPEDQLSAKIKATFDSVDTNGDGSLQPDELEDALAELGRRPSKQELAAILDEFDQDKNGTIEPDEFEHMVRSQLNVASRHCPCRLCDEAKQKSHEKNKIQTAEEQKAAILADARKKAAVEVAKSPPRTTSSPKIVKTLPQTVSKHFSDEERERIERTLSDLANMKVEIKENVEHSKETLENCSSVLGSYYSSIPEEKLTERIKSTFANFDLNGNGVLERIEVENALSLMGRRPTPSELDDLFGMFDSNGDGIIDLSEFHHMVHTMLYRGCKCEFCVKLEGIKFGK